jgi:3-hydroxyisobutyrate dehydrogenase
MGRPMVDHLVAAGHDVTVLSRRPETRMGGAAAGLHCADTVEETVKGAEVVFVVVLTDDQVRSVCLGPRGAVAQMEAGGTLVQHTTSDPATADLIAAEGADRGIKVLDAALSGGPGDIVAGTLTLWVGGEHSTLDEIRPLFETYASPIQFVGPLGNGQRVKLVNNALFVAHVGLAFEAVRIAESLGIEEQAILAAVQVGSGASRGLGVVASVGSVEAVGNVLSDLMRKDVAMVREVARRTSAELGLIGSVLSSDVVEHEILRSQRDRVAESQ